MIGKNQKPFLKKKTDGIELQPDTIGIGLVAVELFMTRAPS